MSALTQKLKMGFQRKSDGLVAQGYANFQKMVWIPIIKLPSIPIFGNLNTLAQQGMQISSDFLRNPIFINAQILLSPPTKSHWANCSYSMSLIFCAGDTGLILSHARMLHQHFQNKHEDYPTILHTRSSQQVINSEQPRIKYNLLEYKWRQEYKINSLSEYYKGSSVPGTT